MSSCERFVSRLCDLTRGVMNWVQQIQIALKDLIACGALSVREVKMAEDLFVMLTLLRSQTVKQLNYPFHPEMHRKILSRSS